jgi:hypothetical protein
MLDESVSWQRRLAQQGPARETAASRLLLVTGQAPLTPAGYSLGDDGFTYLYSASGDGYATHDSAALAGARAWVVPAPHDRLPTHMAAFDAYVELLEAGTTSRLSPAAASVHRTATTHCYL